MYTKIEQKIAIFKLLIMKQTLAHELFCNISYVHLTSISLECDNWRLF